MNFNVKKGAIESFKSDVIVIGCFETKVKKEQKPKPASLQKEDGGLAVDKILKGEITNLIKTEEFTGGEGNKKVLFTAGLIPARYVVLVGLGKKEDLSLDTLRKVGSTIAKTANEVKAKSLALTFHKGSLNNLKIASRMRALVEGMILGSYSFDEYKKEDDRKKKTLNTIYFLTSQNPLQFTSAINAGLAIGRAVNLARDLSNTPSCDMTPTILSKKAKEISTKGRLNIDVMGVDKIKANKMEAFLTTAQGSDEKPVFIHLSYKPTKKAKANVAIVGKGITFDAGGISLKPPRGMDQMKDDMAGAATALAVIQAAAQMKLPVKIEAFIPACENMPSGKAIKPGDIVKARNGKTIEIISTDAEGRMILADALSFAADKKPDYLIDLATLTGACAYAVGERYIAVLGNDQRLVDKLKKNGEEAGEPLWQLPLEEEYKKGLTKGIADLKNIGSSKADTINASLFLREFVGDAKWAHLDIASTSWTDEDKPYAPRGSTGAGVRVLLYFLMNL